MVMQMSCLHSKGESGSARWVGQKSTGRREVHVAGSRCRLQVHARFGIGFKLHSSSPYHLAQQLVSVLGLGFRLESRYWEQGQGFR